MKKKICKIIFASGAFLIWGIAGGIDCGEPLSNAWWCIPIIIAMLVSVIVGKLFYWE